MLVLCDEIAAGLKVFLQGIQIDEDTLAVETTRRGYKDHSFLMDEHTLKHMREAIWRPSVFQRITLERWSEPGSVMAIKRVRDRVTELLHS